MSRRSVRKGKEWERTVARRFREYGIHAERNLSESRTGNAGDLLLPPDIPLSIQAKVGARPPIYQAVHEAQEAAAPGEHPVAVIRRNAVGSRRYVDLAVLPLEDFLELVAQLRTCGAW